MEQIIQISGYAKTYQELCNVKGSVKGEYYNVLEQFPFITYVNTGETTVGDTLLTTDVLGWYETKEELELAAKIKFGDVYITGTEKPYTRWKAVATGNGLQWEEDGEEMLKIMDSFKDVQRMGTAHVTVKEDEYYGIGKEMPLKVYGIVSVWEPVGAYITYTPKRMTQIIHKDKKSKTGEIACLDGIFYVYNGKGWEQLLDEPMNSVGKHTYFDGMRRYRLREGSAAGTLEYYQPRELI